MKILVILVISYLITDFLYIYCYDKLLGRKYSMKVTVAATLALWGLDCLTKIVPQTLFGVENVALLNIVTLFTGLIYVVMLYKSAVWKRILIMVLYIMVTILTELVGINIATAITGDYEMYQAGSSYTLVASVCSVILVSLGTFAFVWVWKFFEESKQGLETYQWLGWILPFSQYLVIQHTATRNHLNGSGSSIFLLLGALLGGLADVYMFHCFIHWNEKKALEAELREMQQQYEKEKLRYEELREKEEEIARIRHDFGNYVLVMKSMVEK